LGDHLEKAMIHTDDSGDLAKRAPEAGIATATWEGTSEDRMTNPNGNILLEGEFEIWRNTQWRVTNHVIEEVGDATTIGPPYWISLEDLGDPEWPEHVCGKTWVKPQLFVEAYRKACEIAGLRPNEAGITVALHESEHV
jgi:hypothetical protein